MRLTGSSRILFTGDAFPYSSNSNAIRFFISIACDHHRIQIFYLILWISCSPHDGWWWWWKELQECEKWEIYPKERAHGKNGAVGQSKYACSYRNHIRFIMTDAQILRTLKGRREEEKKIAEQIYLSHSKLPFPVCSIYSLFAFMKANLSNCICLMWFCFIQWSSTVLFWDAFFCCFVINHILHIGFCTRTNAWQHSICMMLIYSNFSMIYFCYFICEPHHFQCYQNITIALSFHTILNRHIFINIFLFVHPFGNGRALSSATHSRKTTFNANLFHVIPLKNRDKYLPKYFRNKLFPSTKWDLIIQHFIWYFR